MEQKAVNPQRVLELAEDAGLDLAGVMPASSTPRWEAYETWVAQGYAGSMDYLQRPVAMALRQDPRRVLPGAHTVLVGAARYAGGVSPALPPLHGRVARYAWQSDYHTWLRQRLEHWAEALRRELGGETSYRVYVDSGPVVERAWAAAAGLGWVGNNGLVLHPRLGSYFFLGVVLLSASLPPTPAPRLPSCGTCRRCIEACPTGAIVAPKVVDARRCLSYLTIESRESFPEALRPALGERIFGCDVCQEVCPWNARAPVVLPGTGEALRTSLDLTEALMLDARGFTARYRRSPVWRATQEGLARNAAVCLGNLRDPAARPALRLAVEKHPSALVREHAGWALARL